MPAGLFIHKHRFVIENDHVLTFNVSNNVVQIRLRYHVGFCVWKNMGYYFWVRVYLCSPGLLRWHWGIRLPGANEVIMMYMGKINLSQIKAKPKSWGRHQMETVSALLALCAGNSPVTGVVIFTPMLILTLPYSWWIYRLFRYNGWIYIILFTW